MANREDIIVLLDIVFLFLAVFASVKNKNRFLVAFLLFNACPIINMITNYDFKYKIIIYFIRLIFCLILYFIIVKQYPKTVIKKEKKGSFRKFLIFFIGSSFSILCLFYFEIYNLIQIILKYIQLNYTFNNINIIWNLIDSALVGFLEESVFRLFVFRMFIQKDIKGLSNKYKNILVYLFVAAFFTWFHKDLTILQCVNMFVSSLLYSYAYEKTESLWFVASVHALHNFGVSIIKAFIVM